MGVRDCFRYQGKSAGDKIASGTWGGDFGARINEIGGSGVVRQVFHFSLLALSAVCLELFELAESLIHRAVQPLFVDAEVHKSLRVRAEGPGGGHGGMDFGVVGLEIARGFEVTLGEHAVFNGTNTIYSPLIVGYGLGELTLDRGLRVEAVDDLFGKCVVSGHVFRGEDDDARSESMTQSVHAGAFSAPRRGGAMGFFDIQPVGCVLSC